MIKLKNNCNPYLSNRIFIVYIFMTAFITSPGQTQNYPHPENNPGSSIMLAGEWFERSHDIHFDRLPKIPSQHSIVSHVKLGVEGVENFDFAWEGMSQDGGVNQHNYLSFYNGQYWIMWSDGPGVEDRVGQVVKYSTSKDGLDWSEAKFLTPYPYNSGPESPFYNTRTKKGFRWISRGFWQRNGDLLALASIDEAAGFFVSSLELRAFKWNEKTEPWMDIGQVFDNAINNFPPKKLPTGEWMMSRRTSNYKEVGVQFLIGGLKGIDHWKSYPVMGSDTELDAEEPFWWILPDGKNLMALFRDNGHSGYLYRSFSTDNGITWSEPVQTNFPDARSKIHGIRLRDGRYILISYPNPLRRDPLTLSISEDGLVFTKMGYLVGGRQIDYPYVLEHEGNLIIAFAGSVKQKIEVLKVKISDLDSLDMSKRPSIIIEKRELKKY